MSAEPPQLEGLTVGERVVASDRTDAPREAVVVAVGETTVTLRLVTHQLSVNITSVRVVAATTVQVDFDDGTTRTRDLEPLMHGPVFDPVRNDRAAFGRVTIDAASGSLTWPSCDADIDPELLRYDELWEPAAGFAIRRAAEHLGVEPIDVIVMVARGELASDGRGDKMRIPFDPFESMPTCVRCEQRSPQLPRQRAHNIEHNRRLMVVRDVPMTICADCGEQTIDEPTGLQLDGFAELLGALPEGATLVVDYNNAQAEIGSVGAPRIGPPIVLLVRALVVSPPTP